MTKPFAFLNPGKVRLLAGRVKEQNVFVDTSGQSWHWEDGGRKCYIDWESIVLDNTLQELLKYYICFRLENYAPQTVFTQDALFIRKVAGSPLGRRFPWGKNDVVTFLGTLSGNGLLTIYFSLKSFYKFCLNRSLTGFSKEGFRAIEELRPSQRSSYEKVYLRQNIITPKDETILLRFIECTFSDSDLVKCRDNIILHLGYELAPRPIQIHSIDEKDFNVFSAGDSKYYSINLPMAKKMRSGPPEKRLRSISNGLGEKIQVLIKLNRMNRIANVSALFIEPNGKRLGSPKITKVVSDALRGIGFKKGDSLTLLRHHLGQSLADQGAPADTIAELLGHNSTVPARAYVGATPEISSIKTRALGKNGTYLGIMKILITGEIVEKEQSPKDRWVKGVVGSQYIGGIGACGLSSGTSCPKNPVYSCYTCSKFHPFRDGSHAEVRKALERQSQYFVDTAINGLQIESNRPLTQLELTLEAVDSVIAKCQGTLRT